VWPYPGSEVTSRCYDETLTEQQHTDVTGRGVGATILVYNIDTSLTSNDPPEDDRVHLYVDDERASEKSLIFTNWLMQLVYIDEHGNETPSSKSTEYSLSWAPHLSPGLHEARIEIIRDNGELLTYEWSFTITDP